MSNMPTASSNDRPELPAETATPSATAAPPRRRPLRTVWILAIGVWALLIGAGLERIWAYNMKPGMAAPAPQVWPGSGLIQPSAGSATLVMFVHPQCPCSRASVAELQVAMERSPKPVSAWVLFLRPDGTDSSWEKTPLWESARRIPGVTVLTDSQGSEAARFGASTSGHAVLYSSEGRLLFGGGITGSRGHVGDNDGLRQVLNLLGGSDGERNSYPVFGCSLHEVAANRP